MSLRLVANPARVLVSGPVRFLAIKPSPCVGLVRLYSQRILTNGLVSDRPPRVRQKTGDKLAAFVEDPADPEDLLDHEGPWNKISDAVKSDHRQLEMYYTRIVNSTDVEEQERYQNAFVWKLSRHSMAEELVVYPSFEKYIPGGYLLAKKDRSHHLELKAQLYKFQKLEPSIDKQFIPALNTLWKQLKDHIKEEEEHNMPQLEAAISDSKSRAIADMFEYRKNVSPTRSHPWVPSSLPWETLFGSIVAPWDKMRDKWRQWPRDLDQHTGAGPSPS